MVGTPNIKINSSMISDFTTPVSNEDNKNKYLKVNDEGKIIYQDISEIADDVKDGGLSEELSVINEKIDNEVQNINNNITLLTSKHNMDIENVQESIANVIVKIDDDIEEMENLIESTKQTLIDDIELKADKETTYTKTEVDNLINTSENLVHTSGTESIAGDKTFTGSTTFTQNIQGTAVKALWGDLAEYYESDFEYPKGTLVQFGGDKEITIASLKVNAVITSEPGFILNSNYDGQAIALCGRVPVRIIGKVAKFDSIVLSETLGIGRVKQNDNEKVIAIALEENLEENEKLVLCVTKLEF